MAKSVKKKNRRLKRSIRKTFGALFMASAIAIAAIPTQGLQAEDDYGISMLADATYTDPSTSIEIDDIFKYMPKVNENATIYTTGDGMFQFAYVDMNTGENTGNRMVAVILGYDNVGSLEGGRLVIPNTVEAYKKFSYEGTKSGYVAVNLSGDPLFYRTYVDLLVDGKVQYEKGSVSAGDQVDGDGNKLDKDGKPIPIQVPEYKPCTYGDHSKWENENTFYVREGSDSNYKYTESPKENRISAAEVCFIGSQKLIEGTGSAAGTWTVGGEIEPEDKGVFAGYTNIVSLVVGDNIMGIGNRAFAGCPGLSSITLANGLMCLGNSAFENCANLVTANIDPHANISIIGSKCFYNCQNLSSFDMPIGVTQIGDLAFADCFNLTEMNLINPKALDENGKQQTGLLQELGNGVFKNCRSLKNITFPNTFTNNGRGVDVSEFEGCTSLEYIKTDGNASFTLKDNSAENSESTMTFQQFKDTVSKTFFFEGPENGALHQTSNENGIAFRFYSERLQKFVYELKVTENSQSVTYQVDDDNQLVYIKMPDKMETITMPENIGPKNINAIADRTFQGYCYLETITIPASVASIGDDAFRGCHRLSDVIFTDAEQVVSIGKGAFSTQDAQGVHKEDCSDAGLELESELHFIGTISSTSVPFNYAMQSSRDLNPPSSSYRTYITYYSGWPMNLEVRFNEYTGMSELIDYPTLADLGTKYENAKGYVYMTKELEDAVDEAVRVYTTSGYNSLSTYQQEIIDTVLHLELPDGIESIAYVDSNGKLVSDAWVLDEKTGQYVFNERYTVSGGDGDSGIMSLFTYKEGEENLKASPKTLTAYGIREIRDNAFKECNNFTAVTFAGPLESVGNYAFEGCDNLSSVSLSESISEMGLRPFTGCEKLSHVEFNGSENFSCDDSLIFKQSANGKALVEYLCARPIRTVDPEELADVAEIYPEAFMATNVTTVDLRQSSVTNVPVNAFRETAQLFAVWLPNTCKSISADAFTDSGINGIHIPKSVQVISNDAFRDIDHVNYPGMTKLGEGGLVIYSDPDSVAYIYAQENNIMWREETDPTTYWVGFYKEWDHVGEEDYLIVELEVEEGTDAYAAYKRAGYDPPEKTGYTFERWSPDVSSVTYRMNTGAVYTENDTSITVTFWDRDWDDEDGVSYKVMRKDGPMPSGSSVTIPQNPYREGYTFIGWLNGKTDENNPGYFGPYTQSTDLYAQYEKGDSLNGGNGSGGGTGDDGTGGNGSGGGGTGGNGSGGNGSGGGTGGDATFYTLTVKNGSGSGSYVAGSQPIVIANDPSSTQQFSHWTIDPDSTTIASKSLAATVITMPENNVTVTAHYTAKTGSSSGGGSSSSANSSRPNNGSGKVGGTTVVIDKNGLSNTGVVSATVNGSSDNFTVKITESSSATEAVVRALMAEYGSLDNIKYFPMDISLYDSTGTKKITDTTGLSVSITLPLPDSLITYAGNNKVAGVVNDKLDKLSAKFTTIQGVSCVTFTAEHFSPYVIYVDTAHLSAGTSSDSTPKTGDGIHPKWFLSIGLACLSFVMFMQKDRRKPQKVKVKAKA